MPSPRLALILIIVLLALRAVFAALLPLSADEAYYWLWSQHPAWGYFDHPPMIAWLIRAGTLVLGDTPLGVRAAGEITRQRHRRSGRTNHRNGARAWVRTVGLPEAAAAYGTGRGVYTFITP